MFFPVPLAPDYQLVCTGDGSAVWEDGSNRTFEVRRGELKLYQAATHSGLA